MKYSKKAICVLFGLMVIIGFFFIIPNSKGIQREVTIGIDVSKDTFADEMDRFIIHGSWTVVMMGNGPGGQATEGYFYFDFSNKSNNITKAVISFGIWEESYLSPQKLNFTVCLIEDNWLENTLTWRNKPNKSQVIGYILYNSAGIYEIDITPFITGRSNISLCIYREKFSYYGAAMIYSREKLSSLNPLPLNYTPQLHLSYMEKADITVTNPTSNDNWEVSHTYTIQWNSTGSIDGVKIELYNRTTFVEEIVGYVVNGGEYSFIVNPSKNFDTEYRIKIIDYTDSRVYGYSEYFSISNTRDDLNIPSYNLFLCIVIFSLLTIILTKKVTNKL